MCVYNVVANANDPENDTLTYVWEYQNVFGTWVVFGGNSSTATTPDFNTPGDIEIRCTVSDGVNADVVSNLLTVTVIGAATIVAQNVSNAVECSETGELFISGADPNSTIRVRIFVGTLTGEGNADFTYNSPSVTTNHDGSISNNETILIVDTDASGEAIVSYTIDADPNNDDDGSYNSTITLVDNTGTQIGTSEVSISDGCTATPPADDITIIETQDEDFDGGCTTCASIQVNVPNGETRQVEFAKTGIGPYGSPGALCSNTGSGVTSDNIFNISADTVFDFGVDASRGGAGTNTATTSITVTVRDGGTVLDTYTLSRSHRDPVINC